MPYVDAVVGKDRVRLRRSFTAGEVPAAGELRSGELAINVADGFMYAADADGSVRVLGSMSQVVSDGAISDLTVAKQAKVMAGSIVTTIDGRRWVYSGDGSKAQEASYIELADVTPVWSVIASKPTTFPPETHSHGISDVTGLQTALDGKQASGSYASATHGHAIADVTGLQTALDGKQASGSYAAATHGHAISDVTGLQNELNGKQAAGSYAAASHSHAISDVTGLQTALDGKQASGSYITSDTTGISGADSITNIVSLTQAEYDALGSKSASTLYVIT